MDVKNLHKEEIDELISLYINGEINETSLRTLKQWSELSDENNLYVRSKIEIWFSSGVAADKTLFNKDEAYQRFMARR